MDDNECPDCNHPIHEPGQCARDNCGSSEIIYLHGPREMILVLSSPGSTLTGYNYDFGHVVPSRRPRY